MLERIPCRWRDESAEEGFVEPDLRAGLMLGLSVDYTEPEKPDSFLNWLWNNPGLWKDKEARCGHEKKLLYSIQNSIQRQHSKTAFMVKVAIEAAKEQETLQELATRFEVSPAQISQWKRQLMEGAGNLFERPDKKPRPKREQRQSGINCFEHQGNLLWRTSS